MKKLRQCSMGQSTKVKIERLGLQSLITFIVVLTVWKMSYSMMEVTHQQKLLLKI